MREKGRERKERKGGEREKEWKKEKGRKRESGKGGKGMREGGRGGGREVKESINISGMSVFEEPLPTFFTFRLVCHHVSCTAALHLIYTALSTDTHDTGEHADMGVKNAKILKV